MGMKVLVVIRTLGKPLDTYVQDFGEMDGYEAALAAHKNLVDTYDRLPPGEYEIIALGIGVSSDGSARLLYLCDNGQDVISREL